MWSIVMLQYWAYKNSPLIGIQQTFDLYFFIIVLYLTFLLYCFFFLLLVLFKTKLLSFGCCDELTSPFEVQIKEILIPILKPLIE